ncbi:MAG TPA: glutamate mutase L [Solirubrobacterales bacterium]|nr:glutamate mutase L [Solirubrobacterales bacterium]
MRAIALADFGSTYTKLSLVEPEEGRLLARAEAPTSIGTDLMDGYAAALAKAESSVGGLVQVEEALAASSAGGGLRVVAVGLVPDLTAAAARQAALNAGARVEAVLAGELGADQLDQLRAARPEIVLFAGGTDGGQADLVLENARRLAEGKIAAHFVVACNSAVAEEAAALLRAAGASATVAENVMPKLGEIAVDSAREGILQAFLEHVIGGKGLSASPEFERMVRMPTPEAVLEAVRLLAQGTEAVPGVGDVVVIDIGGATTDIHSSRVVEAATPGIEDSLLPPPPTLRTVEGDLGLRSGAAGVLAADARWLEAEAGSAGAVIGQAVSLRSGEAKWLPKDPEKARLDHLLAVSCATHALRRHCGTMLLSPGNGGPPTLVRNGPDLREVAQVIGTGGVFAHRDDGREIIVGALSRRAPHSLAPHDPAVSIDHNYILAAAGLFAGYDADAAARLLQHELDLQKLDRTSNTQ